MKDPQTARENMQSSTGQDAIEQDTKAKDNAAQNSTRSAASRRDFLRGIGMVSAGMALGAELPGTAEAQRPTLSLSPIPPTTVIPNSSGIPRKKFGKTGLEVSVLGVGGYHIGAAQTEDEGIRIVHEAIDAGVNFFDNAWEYNKGVSEERMGKALAGGRREKVVLMTKVCTHGRDAKVAMDMLDESLRRLQTDHLDVWQIHEVVYYNDPERHFAKGGVVEALDKAKQQGKVRFVGFTGHKDPDIHLKMLSYGYPFDTVQMPLNPFDSSFRSFEQRVLPELIKRQIAPISMKSMSGSGESIKNGALTAAEALRYAMSLPCGTTVSGMETAEILRQNLAIARGFTPMTLEEMNALRQRSMPYAADGHFEMFKTTIKYDGDEARIQHGFPLQAEVPL